MCKIDYENLAKLILICIFKYSGVEGRDYSRPNYLILVTLMKLFNQYFIYIYTIQKWRIESEVQKKKKNIRKIRLRT